MGTSCFYFLVVRVLTSHPCKHRQGAAIPPPPWWEASEAWPILCVYSTVSIFDWIVGLCLLTRGRTGA